MSYYTTSWLTINEHRVRNRSQEVVVTKYIQDENIWRLCTVLPWFISDWSTNHEVI